MSQNNFSGDDYDFAAGSIKGLRSWGMDSLGRLHGVTHAEVWLPGENVAICKKSTSTMCPEFARRGTDVFALRPPHFRPCGAAGCDGYSHHLEPRSHSFSPSCDCGFWAYDEHTFKDHGPVVGVIEGYGRTTIGTRGFRCEKARIVALCRDYGGAVLSLSAWLRLQQLYPDAEFFEDFGEMVSKHGGVLRQWDPVGEDFWTKSVAQARTGDALTQYLNQALQRGLISRQSGGLL